MSPAAPPQGGRVVERARRLHGTLELPSDKSIAHRALILNGFAEGAATVRMRRPGADVRSTMDCLVTLGLVSAVGDEAVTLADAEPVSGVRLDCGNSGTTMRLLAGVLAGRPLEATLDGDASLRRRPMERVAVPLRAMGADVATADGRAPMIVRGHDRLAAVEHRLPVASAQLVGAVAFAALAADGRTRIDVPGPTRDHTERLLAWMGAKVKRKGWTTTVDGPMRPRARSVEVPGDPSAAAAWLVAGAVHPDAWVRLAGVGVNASRLAFVEVLREMGAELEVRVTDAAGPEPVGELAVRGGGRLRPVRIGGERVAALIDELPLLAVAMASIDGWSELRDAGELRVKESDRIAAMVAGLAAIGARVEELPDGWRVARGVPCDASVRTHGDHRVAMAFAVAAATGIAGSVELDDPACIDVSYPGFFDDLESLR